MAKKKFITILPGSVEVHLHKDMGIIPFTIGSYEDWESSYAYLECDGIPIENKDFEKNCKLICIGKRTNDWHTNRKLVINFIKQHIKEYDVVNFYNYGGHIWEWAYYCKKYNPKIIVWSKLDMGMGGYRHFREDNFLRKIKNYFEKFKSQYVDLFSVETYGYYENLKDNTMFRNRLIYFPNGLELLNNENILTKKENILLHVARIGTYQKNSELLIEALNKVNPEVLKDWKIYLVGSYTEEFKIFLNEIQRKNKILKESVVLTGDINDRSLLYSYYAKAKIFCLTSRFESFGIAALEALYYKNYLLLSNYGLAAYDITGNESYGKVIDSFDSNTWAKEIEQAMLDYSIEEKVKDAKEFVLNQFNYKINVNKLIEKVNDLMK